MNEDDSESHQTSSVCGYNNSKMIFIQFHQNNQTLLLSSKIKSSKFLVLHM